MKSRKVSVSLMQFFNKENADPHIGRHMGDIKSGRLGRPNGWVIVMR